MYRARLSLKWRPRPLPDETDEQRFLLGQIEAIARTEGGHDTSAPTAAQAARQYP